MALVILAAVTGDSVGYELGPRFGPRILKLPLLQKRGRKLDNARHLLARRGGVAVFVGRFTAFFRAVMPALAGLSRMPYGRFLLYNAVGRVIWGSRVGLLGYVAGNAYLTIANSIGHNVTVAVLGTAVPALIFWRIRKHRRSGSGRFPVDSPWIPRGFPGREQEPRHRDDAPNSGIVVGR